MDNMLYVKKLPFLILKIHRSCKAESNPSIDPSHSLPLAVTELTRCRGIQHIATLLLVANCIVGVGAGNVSIRAGVL